ncbi:hypothetical protein KP509_09G000500 [Ceratopteris richardii]|uniref:serine O-acetyltransferase n=1 Tax=Ceratopteris richardii TaxID=49495 RepID=A0A8T2U3D7_CERRI|nr:hypothetical protein KP509_09G000500 [Ceratopteris richardii]
MEDALDKPHELANGVSYASNGNTKALNSAEEELWITIRQEASDIVSEESFLSKHLNIYILCHGSLEHALGFLLANKLASSTLNSDDLYSIFLDALRSSRKLIESIYADLKAIKEKDPACTSYCHCILNFKGFQACQSYRVSHYLWGRGRKTLACVLQSRISEVFDVDIHPAAKIGKGVLFDHATGVVIGETAVVGDNVSILHGVTLGGTGKQGGDRHPKIQDGVLIGAGASIIGNVIVGEGAKIGAGAVVLMDIPSKTTAVGCPARLVGSRNNPSKLKDIPSETMDHVSYVLEWSDYVI